MPRNETPARYFESEEVENLATRCSRLAEKVAEHKGSYPPRTQALTDAGCALLRLHTAMTDNKAPGALGEEGGDAAPGAMG